MAGERITGKRKGGREDSGGDISGRGGDCWEKEGWKRISVAGKRITGKRKGGREDSGGDISGRGGDCWEREGWKREFRRTYQWQCKGLLGKEGVEEKIQEGVSMVEESITGKRRGGRGDLGGGVSGRGRITGKRRGGKEDSEGGISGKGRITGRKQGGKEDFSEMVRSGIINPVLKRKVKRELCFIAKVVQGTFPIYLLLLPSFVVTNLSVVKCEDYPTQYQDH